MRASASFSLARSLERTDCQQRSQLLETGYIPNMLEVVIFERSPSKWEWRVCNRHGATILNGFECTRRAAKCKGDRALFILLASGWDQMIAQVARQAVSTEAAFGVPFVSAAEPGRDVIPLGRTESATDVRSHRRAFENQSNRQETKPLSAATHTRGLSEPIHKLP
jgi:hypothetical protein